MSANELEDLFHTLTPARRAIVLQTLTQTLGNGSRGIAKVEGVCGGEACIAGTRIPVWLLVESHRQGVHEAQMLNDYPQISAADLVNAWAYSEAYPEEIEAVIRQNEAV
ncbi:MAG: DUF433 domain-containing protein [Phormidesmis sp. CAN_BIN36]|nr:DUF433 domain-containing protein [Phormidesmis sp. CAN_BIN36]